MAVRYPPNSQNTPPYNNGSNNENLESSDYLGIPSRHTGMAGLLDGTYSIKESMLALAIADAGGGGGGGGGLTQAEAQVAFTAALASQNQLEFQDLVLEDSTGTLFLRTKTFDEETGTVVVTNTLPNGTTYVPVGAVTVSGKSDLNAIRLNTINLPVTNWDETSFWAIADGSGYIQGDELIRKRGISGTIQWYNVRTDSIVTPLANDLVQHINDAYVDGTLTTTANTVDALVLTPVFSTSNTLTVPLIGGKRANRISVLRTSTPVVSPLHLDTGILFGRNSLGTDTILPLSSYNRPNQANIAAGGFYSYSHLSPDTLSVSIRNYNISSSVVAVKFSWVDEDPLGIKYGYVPTRVSLTENLLTGLSSTVLLPIDVKKMRLRVGVTGATTNVEFRVQQNISINGVAGFRNLATLVVLAGTADGYIEFDQNFRGGQYRISPVGTFTTYGYQWFIND